MRSGKATLIASCVLFTQLGTPTSALAAGGALDPSFSSDGRVITDLGDFAFTNAVAIQPNRRIVVGGGSDDDFVISRYYAGGRLDDSFGGDGIVETDFGGFDVASAIVVRLDGTANGRIIAAGGTDAGFALARYNPNGSLDSTFGGDGRVVTTGFGPGGVAAGVAVQADGKTVAVGTGVVGNDDEGDFAITRYRPNGSLDPTFSGDGKLVLDVKGESVGRFDVELTNEFARAVVIQPNGRILLGGYGQAVHRSPSGEVCVGSDMVLARVLPGGAPDTTFGGDGELITTFGCNFDEVLSSLALQPDGKILGAGSTRTIGHMALFRLMPNGAPDPSFSGDGKAIANFNEPGVTSRSHAYGVVLQGNGKIVAAGFVEYQPSNQDFAVARFNGDGLLDSTFGGDGRVHTDFGGSDRAFGVALQADGRIVAAGDSDFSSALARYLAA